MTAPFGYTAAEVARSRSSPELEQVQRRATELMQSYARALDDAALFLLAHGCRDIARVLQPNGRDELWIDAPADRARTGEVLPGRCVYRQWMRPDGIAKEWLDPELEAAAKTVQP